MLNENVNKLLPNTWTQKLLLIALGIIVLLNLIVLRVEEYRIVTLKKFLPHQLIGAKFAGLEEFTKNIDEIGYYTDMDAKDEEQQKLFSHAQYMLAPTIVDFNNLDHEYILFVCKNQFNALRKMKEIHAQAFKQNSLGMILAKRTPWTFL